MEHVLKIEPKFLEGRIQQAKILMKLKRYKEAEDILENFINIEPNNEEILKLKGMNLLKQKKFQEALPFLN